MGLAFILAGLFSIYYEAKHILYPVVVFLSLSFCYFILLFVIDWKKTEKSYFAWVMTFYGLVISCEVIYIVISIKMGNTIFISNLGQIFTGWGMRNNIAGQISLCVAAPIYLAIKSKKPLIYLWMPLFMIVSCFLVNSRGGALTSCLIFVIAIIIYFVKVDKIARIKGIAMLGAVTLAGIVLFVVKFNAVKELLSRFFASIGESDMYVITQGRNETWMHGMSDFFENTLFGVGFYQCKDYIFYNFTTGFVPARYHNIYIQFLASTGLFGIAAYFYHRAQTLFITFKKPSLEKTFIYFTVLALVISSLTDNHFFNIGPGLNYCMALAFIEGMNILEEKAD